MQSGGQFFYDFFKLFFSKKMTTFIGCHFFYS